MYFTKILSFALLVTLSAVPAGAQAPAAENAPATATESPVGPPALQEQYTSLRDGSNSYQDYKVIKRVQLDAFWRTVTDSLEERRAQIATAQAQIEGHAAEVSGLQTQIVEQTERITTLEYEKERFSWMGLDVLKDTYSTAVWGLIGILFITALFALFRYRQSHRLIAGSRRDYDQLRAELEDFRRRTHEREVRIKRELQTERNRVEELKQKLPIYQ
ncbi:MAG: hypothetical protein WBA12_03550 [Catalinimonas sp.]